MIDLRSNGSQEVLLLKLYAMLIPLTVASQYIVIIWKTKIIMYIYFFSTIMYRLYLQKIVFNRYNFNL